MSDAVHVVGVGIVPFGKFADATLASLARGAIKAALDDAGVGPEAIEVVSCGSARTGILQGRESGVGQLAAWEVGIRRVPVHNVKGYCASGAAALATAEVALACGRHDVALVVGLEKLSARGDRGRPITSDGMEIEGDIGFSPPAYFGMVANRHAELYGTTREQMAAVAVKNRAAGSRNPIAQYREPIGVADVLAAPPVVEPLGLFDCCPTGDGAAAAVLVSDRALARVGARRAIRLAACAQRSGGYDDHDLTTFPGDVEGVAEAYERAGLGPDDIDVAEVHDAFTIAEIVHYEDLGLCAKGEGGPFAQSPRARTVNPSGGLLSRGHPLGATGVAQVVEVVQQLRGEAGSRQIEGARAGLTHVAGGFMESDIASSVITVLVK
jgi:acetyl-CoA acetyltransferase